MTRPRSPRARGRDRGQPQKRRTRVHTRDRHPVPQAQAVATARAAAVAMLDDAQRQAQAGRPRLLAEILAFLRPQSIYYRHTHRLVHNLMIETLPPLALAEPKPPRPPC